MRPLLAKSVWIMLVPVCFQGDNLLVAATPPTAAGLDAAHAVLRATSNAVQGEIRVYRNEMTLRDALEQDPASVGLPLRLEGRLWRDGDRIRVDYVTHDPKGTGPVDRRHALAIDAKSVYSLSEGLRPDLGSLSIYSRRSVRGEGLLQSFELRFLKPLDALWKPMGQTVLDLLQRPDSTIQSDPPDARLHGVVIRADDGKGNQAVFELDPAEQYPIAYIRSRSESAGQYMQLELRIESKTQGASQLPTRIAEVADFNGKSGYTQVIVLDLEPLASGSPLEQEFSADSFRDAGFGYQVSTIDDQNAEDLGPRIAPPRSAPRRTATGGWARFILWGNGLAILIICAVLLAKRRQGRRRHTPR